MEDVIFMNDLEEEKKIDNKNVSNKIQNIRQHTKLDQKEKSRINDRLPYEDCHMSDESNINIPNSFNPAFSNCFYSYY